MSGLSRETWIIGLRQFYYDCVLFWSNSVGLSEDDSIKLAIRDCLNIKGWPFSPKLIEIPEDIKQEWYADLKSEEYYLQPISRKGVNKILDKMPKHKFWLTYKACDD